MLFADRMLVIDHVDRVCHLVALSAGAAQEAAAEEWLAATEKRLAGVPEYRSGATGSVVLAGYARAATESGYDLQPRADKDTYLAQIRDGESDEICLTNTVPVPYGAYLRYPGVAVLSASPERFLTVDPRGAVESKPIKGTRPRGAPPAEDDELRRDLLSREKDRAENLMIVLGMVFATWGAAPGPVIRRRRRTRCCAPTWRCRRGCGCRACAGSPRCGS